MNAALNLRVPQAMEFVNDTEVVSGNRIISKSRVLVLRKFHCVI